MDSLTFSLFNPLASFSLLTVSIPLNKFQDSTALVQQIILSTTAVVTCFENGMNYKAAGLNDGTIIVLTSSGTTKKILSRPSDGSPATALTSEGYRLVIGRTSGQIEVWKLSIPKSSRIDIESACRGLVVVKHKVLSLARLETGEKWNL